MYTLTVHLPDDVAQQAEDLARHRGTNLGALMRGVLEAALREHRRAMLAEAFSLPEGDACAEYAAERGRRRRRG